MWKRLRSNSGIRKKRFLLQNHSSLLFSGYQGSFPGVKRRGLEADNSPPSGAEVKNDFYVMQ